jgi:type VI secretion system protein ImpK
VKEDIGNLVHPVLSYALRLKERLAQGEAADLETEQATLKGLLLSEHEARRFGDFGGERMPQDASMVGQTMAGRRGAEGFLGIRFALTCWLDEVFILDSPWEAVWENHLLERALYGSRDRAWLFWEQARKAEARPGGDALEVFYLCVMLGFRGEYRHEPDKLHAWIEATKVRLSKLQPQEMPHPAELEPPVHVPPLRWRRKLDRMVLVAAVLVLCVIPFVSFLVVTKMFGQ